MKTRTLLILAAALASGCADYDSADVVVTHIDPSTASDREIAAGGAITVKVTPEGRSDYSGTEAVDVRADSPTVATARKTILSDTWTILGESPGRATFTVYVDGLPLDTFQVTVVPYGGSPYGY